MLKIFLSGNNVYNFGVHKSLCNEWIEYKCWLSHIDNCLRDSIVPNMGYFKSNRINGSPLKVFLHIPSILTSSTARGAGG